MIQKNRTSSSITIINSIDVIIEELLNIINKDNEYMLVKKILTFVNKPSYGKSSDSSKEFIKQLGIKSKIEDKELLENKKEYLKIHYNEFI